MSYTWEYLQKHPKEAKRLVGIREEQLNLIIKLGKRLHEEKQKEKEAKKIRLIRRGGGTTKKIICGRQNCVDPDLFASRFNISGVRITVSSK